MNGIITTSTSPQPSTSMVPIFADQKPKLAASKFDFLPPKIKLLNAGIVGIAIGAFYLLAKEYSHYINPFSNTFEQKIATIAFLGFGADWIKHYLNPKKSLKNEGTLVKSEPNNMMTTEDPLQQQPSSSNTPQISHRMTPELPNYNFDMTSFERFAGHMNFARNRFETDSKNRFEADFYEFDDSDSERDFQRYPNGTSFQRTENMHNTSSASTETASTHSAPEYKNDSKETDAKSNVDSQNIEQVDKEQIKKAKNLYLESLLDSNMPEDQRAKLKTNMMNLVKKYYKLKKPNSSAQSLRNYLNLFQKKLDDEINLKKPTPTENQEQPEVTPLADLYGSDRIENGKEQEKRANPRARKKLNYDNSNFRIGYKP